MRVFWNEGISSKKDQRGLEGLFGHAGCSRIERSQEGFDIGRHIRFFFFNFFCSIELDYVCVC